MRDEKGEGDGSPSSLLPPPSSLPLWRIALAVWLCVLPWPAAWAGLYHLDSAPFAFLFYHGVCILGGFLLRSPGLPERDDIYQPRRRHLLGVVLGANAIALVAYTVAGALLLDGPRILGLLSERGLAPGAYLWLFPYFVIVNPWVEEFFWRGGVYATLRRVFASPLVAALVSSACFGAWHWLVLRLFLAPAVALLGTLTITLVGIGLTFLYERTRRLLYPVALHALAGDAPILLCLFLLGRG